MDILKQFKEAGMNASYHYADDSGKEWKLGAEESRKCYALAKAHPELLPQMWEIARGFLFMFNPQL